MKYIVIFCILLLTACSSIEKGVVTKKEHYPAYVRTTVMPVIVGKTTTIVPVTTYVKECHELTLKNESDCGTICVPQSTFETVEIGKWYDFSNKTSTD